MSRYSDPFISIDYWLNKSDVLITCSYKNGRDNYDYTNDIEKAYENKNTILIFLKSDLIEQYIHTLLKLTKNFILITGSNDDHCMPYLYYPCRKEELKQKVDVLLKKHNLLQWFTKNPSIVHPKICPIPLGPKWQWKTTQFFGEPKTEHLKLFNQFCKTPLESFKNKELKQKLLYFNFSAHTSNAPLYSSHNNIRNKIKSVVSKKFKWNENAPFEKYLEILSTYKFCISPPGRGMDTHRTWEALMMGTIPIMINTPLDYLFENLPVLFVSDWNTVTEDFLNKKYTEITSKEYDFSTLYTDYWNKIINY